VRYIHSHTLLWHAREFENIHLTPVTNDRSTLGAYNLHIGVRKFVGNVASGENASSSANGNDGVGRGILQPDGLVSLVELVGDRLFSTEHALSNAATRERRQIVQYERRFLSERKQSDKRYKLSNVPTITTMTCGVHNTDDASCVCRFRLVHSSLSRFHLHLPREGFGGSAGKGVHGCCMYVPYYYFYINNNERRRRKKRQKRLVIIIHSFSFFHHQKEEKKMETLYSIRLKR
jgi:hypothetical protein